MKTFHAAALCAFALLPSELRADDFLDRLGDALTISAFDDRVRLRLRGTIDLELYTIDDPAPALIFSNDPLLFNPRLSLFLDAQIGPHLYLFAQARFDRGFDPQEEEVEARFEEYAIRVSPWSDGRFNLQFGRFATIVGNWGPRHYSWDNPFVTAPLPYENLTGIWDSVAPDSAERLLGWAHVERQPGNFSGDEFLDKHLRQPIIWGPSYGSGAAALGRIGKFEYAAEVKNTSLSSRPESWDLTETQWQHPTFSTRLGFRPNEMWNIGLSASRGSYLRREAEATLPPGHGIDDYRQSVLGHDIGFAWHHLQLWAEFYFARFDVPRVGHPETSSYYLEAKYKLTPQLFGALRWNQQFFSRIGPDDERWGRNTWRVDAALGYRHSAHTQLKVQYSLQQEDSAPRRYGHILAMQFTVRF